MLQRARGLLGLVFLFGAGQAGPSMAGEARFIHQLPHATVELIGISHFPLNRESQWWRPDGAVAPLEPYCCKDHPGSLRSVRSKLSVPTKALAFLVRVESPRTQQPNDGRSAKPLYAPETSPPTMRVPTEQPGVGVGEEGLYTPETSPPTVYVPRDAYSEKGGFTERQEPPVFGFTPYGPSWQVDYIARVRTDTPSKSFNLFAPWWNSGQVMDVDGNCVPDYWYLAALAALPSQTADLRVGVALGPWETVVSQKPDRAGRSRFQRLDRTWAVTFRKAEAGPTTDKTQVEVQTTIGWFEGYARLTQRVVAATRDGSEQATPWGNGRWESGRTITFDLPLSAIEEFRFQVRPYDWVEFRNVSLVPGRRTVVTAVRTDVP